jgi:hypothetical protein
MAEYRKDLQHSDRDRRDNCRYFDTPLDGIEIFRHLIQRIHAGMTLAASLSYGTDLLFPRAAPSLPFPSRLIVHPVSAPLLATPELSLKQLSHPQFFSVDAVLDCRALTLARVAMPTWSQIHDGSFFIS